MVFLALLHFLCFSTHYNKFHWPAPSPYNTYHRSLLHYLPLFFSKKKMKLKQWIYFAIAFGGVALLKGFDERVSLSFMLVGIISAMFSGMAYTCIRQLKETDHPLVVVFYFPLLATPIMGVLSYFQWVKTNRKGLAHTSANGSFYTNCTSANDQRFAKCSCKQNYKC